jgi:uncharacterized protein YbcI
MPDVFVRDGAVFSVESADWLALPINTARDRRTLATKQVDCQPTRDIMCGMFTWDLMSLLLSPVQVIDRRPRCEWEGFRAMNTQGEIEAAICAGITRFEQEYMGRGPEDIHTHLIGDLVVVRLKGVLTAAEQHLVQSLSAEKGRDLLKDLRTHLVETARPVMETMVQDVTGVRVVSLHHDISTTSGEEVVVFTLAAPPGCGDAKKRAALWVRGPGGRKRLRNARGEWGCIVEPHFKDLPRDFDFVADAQNSTSSPSDAFVLPGRTGRAESPARQANLVVTSGAFP